MKLPISPHNGMMGQTIRWDPTTSNFNPDYMNETNLSLFLSHDDLYTLINCKELSGAIFLRGTFCAFLRIVLSAKK